MRGARGKGVVRERMSMHHKYSLKGEPVPVALEDIDETPGPYTMSFGFDSDKMVTSMEKAGIIHPPLIERLPDGKAEVIAGYRRIQGARHLGWKQVPCFDLTDRELSSLEKLLLGLYDNLATRAFNDVEKGMVLERLNNHVSRKEILADYMPLLGLPSHEPTLDIFLRIKELEIPARLAIAHERVSFKTTHSLLNMDLESRSSVLEWLFDLMFNFNQQNQFIEYINDISISEDRGIYDVLSDEKLLEVRLNESLNKPQKAKRTLELLRARRFPNLSRAETSFNEMIHSAGLPDGVFVRHSPFFEGPDYRLEIRFRDGKSLKTMIDQVSNLKGLQNLGDPWKEQT